MTPVFSEKARLKKSQFNLTKVDPDNTSYLDMTNTSANTISPAFKFIRFHDVRAVNFTNSGFFDTHMSLLI